MYSQVFTYQPFCTRSWQLIPKLIASLEHSPLYSVHERSFQAYLLILQKIKVADDGVKVDVVIYPVF